MFSSTKDFYTPQDTWGFLEYVPEYGYDEDWYFERWLAQPYKDRKFSVTPLSERGDNLLIAKDDPLYLSQVGLWQGEDPKYVLQRSSGLAVALAWYPIRTWRYSAGDLLVACPAVGGSPARILQQDEKEVSLIFTQNNRVAPPDLTQAIKTLNEAIKDANDAESAKAKSIDKALEKAKEEAWDQRDEDRDTAEAKAQEVEDAFADAVDKATKSYEDAVKNLKGKEISDDYTEDDRRRELDAAEMERAGEQYKAAVKRYLSVDCSERTDNSHFRADRKAEAAVHEAEYNAARDRRDASDEHTNAVDSAYDSFYPRALTMRFQEDAHERELQKELDDLFLPMSCETAVTWLNTIHSYKDYTKPGTSGSDPIIGSEYDGVHPWYGSKFFLLPRVKAGYEDVERGRLRREPGCALAADEGLWEATETIKRVTLKDEGKTETISYTDEFNSAINPVGANYCVRRTVSRRENRVSDGKDKDGNTKYKMVETSSDVKTEVKTFKYAIAIGNRLQSGHIKGVLAEVVFKTMSEAQWGDSEESTYYARMAFTRKGEVDGDAGSALKEIDLLWDKNAEAVFGEYKKVGGNVRQAQRKLINACEQAMSKRDKAFDASQRAQDAAIRSVNQGRFNDILNATGDFNKGSGGTGDQEAQFRLKVAGINEKANRDITAAHEAKAEADRVAANEYGDSVKAAREEYKNTKAGISEDLSKAVDVITEAHTEALRDLRARCKYGDYREIWTLNLADTLNGLMPSLPSVKMQSGEDDKGGREEGEEITEDTKEKYGSARAEAYVESVRLLTMLVEMPHNIGEGSLQGFDKEVDRVYEILHPKLAGNQES